MRETITELTQHNIIMQPLFNGQKIALGTWSWGSGMFGGDQVFGNSISSEQLKEVFDLAISYGLNLWDTATAYGLGASESLLGDFMQHYPREQVTVSTKFTPQLVAKDSDTVSTLFEQNLKNLNTDYVDLYWIHNPMDVEKWTPQLIPLLESGKVKAVGVSNHNLDQLKRANEILGAAGFHISAVQNHYSLLYRASEKAGILDYCKEHGIAFFAYMVLEQGALSGRYDVEHPMPEGSQRAATYNKVLPALTNLIEVLREVGEKYQLSVAQTAMAWAISKGTLPLIGVTKPHHVTDAAVIAQVRLTPEEMSRLETAADATGIDTQASWEGDMEG